MAGARRDRIARRRGYGWSSKGQDPKEAAADGSEGNCDGGVGSTTGAGRRDAGMGNGGEPYGDE